MYKLAIAGILLGLLYSEKLFAGSANNCEKIRTKYFATLNHIKNLKTHCKKDQDCTLLFHSGFVSPGCDLGDSVAKNEISNKLLKELSLLRNEAAHLCPKDEGPWCEAIPYKKAKCSERQCIGSQ